MIEGTARSPFSWLTAALAVLSSQYKRVWMSRMSDDVRVPLFLRVLPDLKADVTDAAWTARMSVSRYCEEALREKLTREKDRMTEAA